MQNKRTLYTVGGVVLALCLLFTCVAAIGSYFYWDRLLAFLGVAQSQKTAQMLPQDTQFYMAMTPNIQTLPGYQNIKTLYIDNPEVQAAWENLQTELEEEADITYTNDIQPWIGSEVVIASPDLTASVNNPSTIPAIVIAAETSDQTVSDQFVAKVLAQGAENDQPFIDEVYQDVTLHIQENEFSDNTIIATFNDFVVFSTDDALVKNMIDKAQGNTEQPNLADNAQFQRVLAELPTSAMLTLYMNPAGLFEAAMADSPVQLPAGPLQNFEAFEGIGMAGSLPADGFQLDFVVTYNPENLSEQVRASFQRPPSPNTILADIPADTLLMFNGNNLNNIWQQTRSGLNENPDFLEGLQDFESELGLSIDEDIFGWMTGEFTLAIVKTATAEAFLPPFGAYALIGTDNIEQATSSLEKVTGVLSEQGMLPPLETTTVDGIEVNGLVDTITGEVQGGYGFYNNYFFVAYAEDSLKSLVAAPQNSLNSSENFSAVRNHLPGSNYGYFYADIDQAQSLIEEQLSDFEREEYEKNGRPFIDPLRAMGFATNTGGLEQGVSKGAFFFLITE